jgi:CheY-like chemotaxis protein
MPGRVRASEREKEPGAAMARVLLVEGDVTARLTLQAVLEASGYSVDSAASAAEAMDKLEHEQYALVLCDLSGPENGCHGVINHARAQDYKPATAVLTASGLHAKIPKSGRLLIEPQDVPALLEKIADLLADRAAGRARRKLRRRSVELVTN